MKNNLKQILEVRGLILDEFWQMTGIDSPKLSRIQNERLDPREDEIRKIANALRISIKKIFPDSELQDEGDISADKILNILEAPSNGFFQRVIKGLDKIIQEQKMDIRDKLKEILMKKGISPETVATFIGCSGMQIRRWIKKEATPGMLHRKAIEEGIKKIQKEIGDIIKKDREAILSTEDLLILRELLIQAEERLKIRRPMEV